MKEKIITAFKTKYQSFGLSNEAVDRIASAKEKTVTKEEDIEAALSDVEAMTLIAKEVQKMRDGEIQKRTDLQKIFDAYKESHPEQGNSGGGEPDWAKTLREQNERILARQDAAEKTAKAKAALAAVIEAAKGKCPHEKAFNLTRRGFSIRDGETEDAAVARFESEYAANKKEFFSDGVIPPFGSSEQTGGEKEFKDYLKSYADSRFGEKKD